MNADAVTLVMRIAASRLDPNVAPGTFVEMILELVDLTHEAAVREAIGTDDLPPHMQAPSSRIPLADEGKPPAPRKPPASSEPAAAPSPPSKPARPDPEKPKPAGRRCSRSKISYDDRVRIRQRAAKAKEGRQRYPKGFVAGLAAEYGVSDQAIYNVLQD